MSASATYPIALACGFTRFDTAVPWKWMQRPGRDEFHYFKRIRSTLIRRGFQVFHTNVSWGAPLAARAAELGREIDSILAISEARKVHVIAHSMGGLDARFAISFLGYAPKVCSLTTVATPHHGSPLADIVHRLGSLPRRILDRLYAWGIDLRGVLDLATSECAARNARMETSERSDGVVYQTYAGATSFWPTFFPLKLGYLALRFVFNEAQNDGLVPLSSAKWREEYFRGAVPWDHLNQLGWWTLDRILAGDAVASHFERKVREFYGTVAQELHALQEPETNWVRSVDP